MKQYSSLVFCLLMAFSGRSLGAPVDGSNGECPGGLANGAPLERGRFYYECRDGNIVPKGCLTDDLKKIEIGSSFDKKTYRLTCSLGSDNLLSLEPTACIHQGAEHKIDEQWEDSTNFFTCKKDGKDLRTINSGCVDQGKRVNLNEKVTKDDNTFVCNSTVNNGAKLVPAGCVKEGKEYNVGDSFEAGKYWFTCTRVGSAKVVAKPAGCVNNGKRLNDGDRFHENEVAFECRVDTNKQEVITTGCVQSDEKGQVVERRLGCTWVEGQEPFQYEMACQQDAATNSAKKVQVRCNYKVGTGVYNIDPGCFRTIEKAAFGCLKDGAGLKLQSFQGDNAEQAATSAGLHAC